ncbi:hypothetical protein [Vibrio ostreicida]|nr:hypothetical protein [Vibrio ostreicida]
MFSGSTEPVYYPTLSESIYSTEGVTVIDSNNVLKTAISTNQYVMVSAHERVNQNIEKVFSEVLESRAISALDLQQQSFHVGLERIIKQFSCELFSSQQPFDSIQLCPPDHKIVGNNLGYLPFKAGLHTTHRLSISTNGQFDKIQMNMFLKSTHERALTSLWGAIHELGKFDHSDLQASSLVLTVNLVVHKKSETSLRWEYLHPKPLVFFIVLPSVDLILSKRNEVEGMNFAYKNAKMLLVDNR